MSTIGHNSGPQFPPLEATQMEWEVHLAGAFAFADSRLQEISGALDQFLSENPEITDETTQGRGAEFRRVLSDAAKLINAAHHAQKQPILAIGRWIDEHKNARLRSLEAIEEPLKQIMNKYAIQVLEKAKAALNQQAEEALLSAQEAAALAVASDDDHTTAAAARAIADAHAAQSKAQAKTSDLTRVRGEFGAVVSLRERWTFDEGQSDLMALVRAVARGDAPLCYVQFNTARIGAAIRQEGVRAIPGCAIIPKLST